MKRFFAVMVAVAALMIGSSAAFAQMMKDDPMVGGAAMYPGKTIVANAMNSADTRRWLPLSKLPDWSTR